MPTSARWFKPLLMVLCLLLLSGCVDADMHVTVNWDGSGTYQLKIVSHPLVAQELESFKAAVQQSGYDVQPIQEGERTGWVATRSVENVAQNPPGDDLLDIYSPKGKTASSLPFPVIGRMEKGPIQVDSSLFRTHILFHRDVDLTSIAGNDSVGQAFVDEMNLTFRLTLPLAPDEHNADQVSADEKTLTWNLKPGEVQPVQVEWYLPNPITVVILVLIAFLLLAAAIVIGMIRRVRRK
ncbi:DUF3153 domain-containing protein [Desmospora profundinema]|uniref:DUF3153 domain-containing protein n=1 Tax=Desmospora profundinema TaxID=1571184 RepID=A0ABU1IRQ6_9BACL|nr:DUF3153 domain-containing protein [Desmospora profundinema]MDR6227408.1 hypothetical protein [Desmospora profundinema]